ncbi:hypothetical protein [Streptomyces sp. NPDC013740]|uniref:hypothetical protein n=1 Tax=Streptomyces sp. NPDC013740 TaxID=3364867 RepID=UPI003702DA71
MSPSLDRDRIVSTPAGPWESKVAPTADVVNGTAAYQRVSCSSGTQMAPSLGDGRRAV